MKIKSQTWIVLLIFALMIGAVYYLNNKKITDAAQATPASDISFVFTETDGTPSSIEIKPATGDAQRVKVARDAKNVWALEQPIKTEADQSAAEAAASQISALQVIGTVDADPSNFGFDAPAFVITIKFADGTTHTLEIGDLTPTQSGYYVRLDKAEMMIVDSYGIDSLLQLAAFPPYLNTPTPSPLPPTETPVSPTEAVSTPEVSVTPTP